MINLFGIVCGVGESKLELENENRAPKRKSKNRIKNGKRNLDFQLVFETELNKEKYDDK